MSMEPRPYDNNKNIVIWGPCVGTEDIALECKK